MQAVLLAGGTGKRVFPLAVNKPKPMFKVLGQPLIHYVIETMKKAGVRDFIVVIGHNGEQIKDYLGDGSKHEVNVDYTFQKRALGMANALLTVKEFVSDSFFVVNADDIFEVSLVRNMIKEFKNSGADIVLSCKEVRDTWKYGVIQVEGNRVTKLVEKPPRGQEPSNLVVIGSYIVTDKIFNYFEEIKVSDQQYEDAIQKLIEDGNIGKAVKYTGFFSTFKYPWDLFTINEYLMNKIITKQAFAKNVEVSDRAHVEGNVWIGEGTKVLEGACIRGPCYIGSNNLIGNNCLVWGYSSIGNNSIIGFSTEIKHSLIGDNCCFHMNYIGDSIVSDNCLFGAGTITANFRFDEKSVKVKSIDTDIQSIDSGREKLGAIVADNCKTGINACLLPGVKVGPHSIIGPAVCLYNDLKPNKILFAIDELHVIKNNEITVSSEKRRKLLERLMNYRNDPNKFSTN